MSDDNRVRHCLGKPNSITIETHLLCCVYAFHLHFSSFVAVVVAKVLCVCSISSWILNAENPINIFRHSQSRTADDPWNRRTKDETIKSEC